MAISSELIRRLQAEAERIEEDCTYNNFGHYEAAKRWEIIEHTVGLPILILAAATAFTTFPLPAVATGLTVCTFFLALTSLYLRPADRAAAHYRFGGKFKDLRAKARRYRDIELLRSDVSEEDLVKELNDLLEEKRVLSELGIPLPDFAYRRAKEKIRKRLAEYDRDSSFVKAP